MAKDSYGHGIEKKRDIWDKKIAQVELKNDLSSLNDDDLNELFKWYKYPRGNRLIDSERAKEYANRVLNEIDKRSM